jgi:cysteine-rich repeat protein
MNLMNGHGTRYGLTCNDCHDTAFQAPVATNSSISGITCSSCHGRAEDGSSGNGDMNAADATASAGLRSHHELTFGAGFCTGCHNGDPDPVGEDIPSADFVTKGIDPCDENAFGTTTFGNSGLDNDGDGDRDGDDLDCQAGPVCGNGIPEGNEECDDGNDINGDGCENDCTTTPAGPVCGNGIPEGNEECDDGNDINGDGCENDCTTTPAGPVCGDGVPEGNEECDDGNDINGDGCENDCTTTPAGPVCGDGVPEGNEECDDGNTDNGDGCSSTCQNEDAPVCAEENCTDGSDNDSDSYVDCDDQDCFDDPACAAQPSCGDGNTDPGEECDDGNTNNGDGCDSNCKIEDAPPIDDGAALYDTNCSACHGPLESSTKAGRTADQIQGAIDANTGGMGSLSGLTTEEINAIADALSGGTPPPGGGTVDGCKFNPPDFHTNSEHGCLHAPGNEDPFANGCTACHGADLKGGIAPSCFTCHGAKWESDGRDDSDDRDSRRKSRRSWRR